MEHEEDKEGTRSSIHVPIDTDIVQVCKFPNFLGFNGFRFSQIALRDQFFQLMSY